MCIYSKRHLKRLKRRRRGIFKLHLFFLYPRDIGTGHAKVQHEKEITK